MKKNIILILFTFAIVSVAIYGEDYITRGFIFGLAIVLLCLGWIVESLSFFFCWDNTWHRFLYVMVFISLFCSIFFTGRLSLHLVHNKDCIHIKSAFYTHDLGFGERVETRSLRSNYKQYYSDFDFDFETIYFLHHGKSCSIYNEYRKIIEVPDSTFSVEVKDFGHGALDLIKCGQDSFDLRGTKISDGYKPYIRDVTPDDTYFYYYNN